jgi:hypothetical protein
MASDRGRVARIGELVCAGGDLKGNGGAGGRLLCYVAGSRTFDFNSGVVLGLGLRCQCGCCMKSEIGAERGIGKKSLRLIMTRLQCH